MFGLFLESTPQDNFLFWGMMVLWISIFICTLIIELNTADLTTIWFCLSALVCFILSLFKVNYIVQIIVFCCCSISLLLITRPLTKNIMNKTLVRTNADRVFDTIATVTKTITNEQVGEVKIENDTWRAVSFEDDYIEVGEKVIVHSFNGNKVVVSKVNKIKNIKNI